MPRFAENLIGQNFGRLTVIERVPNDKRRHAQWLCKCSCGNEKIVGARHLKSTVQYLGWNARKMQQSKSFPLFRLWWSWYFGMPRVVECI